MPITVILQVIYSHGPYKQGLNQTASKNVKTQDHARIACGNFYPTIMNIGGNVKIFILIGMFMFNLKKTEVLV